MHERCRLAKVRKKLKLVLEACRAAHREMKGQVARLVLKDYKAASKEEEEETPELAGATVVEKVSFRDKESTRKVTAEIAGSVRGLRRISLHDIENAALEGVGIIEGVIQPNDLPVGESRRGVTFDSGSLSFIVPPGAPPRLLRATPP